MKLLSTQKIEVTTSTAEIVYAVVSWADIDKTAATIYTPGTTDTGFSSATTKTVVPAPASATVYREITDISIYNAGNAVNVITVTRDTSGTDMVIASVSLSPSESLRYEAKAGWDRYTANGERMTSGRDGTDGATGPAGTGTAGSAELNFGSWPGSAHATVAVVDAAILSTSRTEAWLLPAATADHTADEHLVESIRIIASAPAAGIGFAVHGFLPDRPGPSPLFVAQRNNAGGRRDATTAAIPVSPFKRARLYGRWSVGWRWS